VLYWIAATIGSQATGSTVPVANSMGNSVALCCHSKMSAHTALHVPDVSPQTMWESCLDVEHIPADTKNVLSVQVLDPGDALKRGLKWRESRLYGGRETTSITTVTDVVVDQKSNHYCATYSICYVGTDWETQQANQTGTVTICPLEESPEGCWLILTVNFVADGVMGIKMKLCGCWVKRYLLKYISAEIAEWARVAKTVQRERTTNQKDMSKTNQ